MNKCYLCGKGNVRGRSHTHKRGVAGGRWKKRAPKTLKTFKVNLQRFTAIIDKVKMRVRLCAKCVKRIKKDIRDGKKPMLQLIHLDKPKQSKQ